MAQELNLGRGQDDWQAILDRGDEAAFRALVEPHMEALLKAARHDLDYYVAQGYVRRNDLTAEEIVGEALIHAWNQRRHRPEKMSLRGWLLGTQYRVLQGIIRQEKNYREDKAVSLEERVMITPDNTDTNVQEEFWEWYQPDEEILWEDIIPGQEPVDYEVPLYSNRDTFTLDPDSRHVLMMHDEFEMSLPEVAFTIGNTINETAKLLEEARASLHERMIDEPIREEPAPPAPPEGSDE